MTFLEKILLIEKRSSADEKFNIFLSSWKSPIKNKYVYVFYEGVNDRYFYDYYVDVIYIDFKRMDVFKDGCGGKHLVDQIYCLIEKWTENWSKYPKELFLFFCDRDYDTILKNEYYFQTKENGFTTKFYSIESYLITKGVLYRMLDKFNVIGLKSSVLESYFEKADAELMLIYSVFAQKLLKLTLCAMAQRKYEQVKELNKQVSLKDIKMKTFFSLTTPISFSNNQIQLGIKQEYSDMQQKPYQYLVEKMKGHVLKRSDYDYIFDLESQFLEIDFREVIRGKWFVEILFMGYHGIFEKLNEFLKLNNLQKIKDPINLANTESLFTSILHGNIFPEDLKQFLEKNYKKIT